MSDTNQPIDLAAALVDSLEQARAGRRQIELRCPKCAALLAEATGVCTFCGHDPLGYYCDEVDHSNCGHTR